MKERALSNIYYSFGVIYNYTIKLGQLRIYSRVSKEQRENF